LSTYAGNWLRAQVDEDERVLRLRHPWLEAWLEGYKRPPNSSDPTDPVRVLAELRAKRQMIDLFEGLVIEAMITSLPEPLAEALDKMAGCMALPYADRDGYREAWRP
jgi:Family of unknown function (DUF6221)